MKEIILCAAIYFDDDLKHDHQPNNILSGYVICGHRHHNCFMTAHILQPDHGYIKYQEEQGFITNTNRFVDRQEAFLIAKQANQIIETSNMNIFSTGKLFSEDLY